MGFSAYFLITWDIIRYAQNRDFFFVGSGSGANSIVAYCLQITDVDPIELDLYFERFLNPSRSSPPDFDLDFSWKDRDEIIDYVFKRYGGNMFACSDPIPLFNPAPSCGNWVKYSGFQKKKLISWIPAI